jgi:hypothetical protein
MRVLTNKKGEKINFKLNSKIEFDLTKLDPKIRKPTFRQIEGGIFFGFLKIDQILTQEDVTRSEFSSNKIQLDDYMSVSMSYLELFKYTCSYGSYLIQLLEQKYGIHFMVVVIGDGDYVTLTFNVIRRSEKLIELDNLESYEEAFVILLGDDRGSVSN